jgi:hypothetical protein
VSEIVLWDLFGVQVMHSNVHVKAGLNVVLGNATFLELLGCFSHTVGKGLITRRDPASLDFSSFLLISNFLLIFTEHRGDWLHSLLRINRLKMSSRFASLVEFTHSSASQRLVSSVLEPSLVLRDIIGIFLSLRMLRKSRFEIRSIHENVPLVLNLFSVVSVDDMVVSLVGFDFRVGMNRCAGDA